MKTFKKLLAVLTVSALCLSFTACHKKNETAVKVGDYTFTSGYYACALVYADTEARAKVNEQLTEKGKSTDGVNYMKQKIDGVKYEKWVKDKAMDNIKLNAAYKAKCKEKKVKLDEEDISTAESYVSYYWDSYGYKEIFGENGVSKETFTKYTTDTYYAEKYFDKIYGKDGEKALTEEQLKTALGEHYVLADILEATLTGTEEDDNATRDKFEAYKIRLSSAKATFSDIKNEFEETETTADTTETTEDDSPKPLDSNAQLLGDDTTNDPSEYYSDAKDVAVGSAVVVEKEDKLVLIYKLDVLADPYYLTQFDDTLRALIVGDDLNNEMLDFAKTLKTTTNKSAVNLFKVKKIKYPENNQ